MEKIGDLLISLVAIIAWSLFSIFIIWLIGCLAVRVINYICGTLFVWNFIYAMLVYVIMIILFMSLLKRR